VNEDSGSDRVIEVSSGGHQLLSLVRAIHLHHLRKIGRSVS